MTNVTQELEQLEQGFQPRWFMAQWFSPSLLYRIGRRKKASHEQPVPAAIEGGSKPTKDYSKTTEAFGIDYVADLGDAIHPTLSVARSLATEKLHCERPDAAMGQTGAGPPIARPGRTVLARGDVLVMGGDEVYPYPDDVSYVYQTLMPYAWAAMLESGDAATATRDLWALPGNHDYYDTKRRFDEWFCENHTIGMDPNPWTTTARERRHFALRLPGKWWLLGVDTYRTGAVEPEQFAYFAGLAMEPHDRAIVCWSKPVWVDAEADRQAVDNLDAFLDHLAAIAGWGEGPAARRRFAPLLLSGDIHCYARYEDSAREQQRFVCGGGGAFLHPTHVLPAAVDGTGRRCVYPSAEVSKKLASAVAGRFVFQNPHFLQIPLVVGAIGAAATLLGRWGIAATVGVTAAALAAFSLAGRPKRSGSLALGAVFGAAMGGAVVGLAAASASLLSSVAGMSEGAARNVVMVATTAVACSPVIAVLMGGYLAFACRVLGTHRNEAFSAMQIEDHKSFLRMQIGADGDLTLWPVAIEQVGTWRWRAGLQRFFTSIRPSPPRLIEPPLVFSPARGTWDGGRTEQDRKGSRRDHE